MSTEAENPDRSVLDPEGSRPRRREWLLAGLAAVLVAGTVVGATAVVVNRDGKPVRTTSAAASAGQAKATGMGQTGQMMGQMGQMGQMCQQWMATTAAAAQGNAGTWCDQMQQWMGRQGNAGAMTAMMSGAPSMLDTCKQMAATLQPAVGDPAAWCTSMQAWISQHGGMMGSSMMGG